MNSNYITMSSNDATPGNGIRTNEDGLLFVVITISALATCFACIVVSFLLRRVFGIQGCLPFHDDAAWEQVRQNRLMALRQQQYGISTNEDGEGPEWERMMEKRKERKEWYQEYLKPFTMVAKETDFVVSSDQNNNSGNDHETTGMTEDVDEEMPCSSPSSSSQLGLHDSHQCGLKLRKMATKATEGADEPAVVVASSCAICLGEYEVGDSIIWASQPHCRHAFHDDCILTWLSKGKKRCPICRNWFVTKTLFDDLKKQQPPQPMLSSIQSEVEEDIEEVDEEEQAGAVDDQDDDRVDDEIHNEGGDLDEAEYLSERRTAQTADASITLRRSLSNNG